MNQAEQNIYGQNTNFGFPKNQETKYIKTSEGKELPFELYSINNVNAGSSIIRKENNTGSSTDFALVQRQYTENNYLSFSAGTKINSVNDIAWLFRSLEDESVEHAFLLYKFKDDSYLVQQMSTGGMSGTIIDFRLAIGNAFALQPESVTLIHNHPSGRLESSREDRNLLQQLKDIFYDTNIYVEDGIVINLRSGKYLVFNENQNGDRINDLKDQNQEQSEVNIYSFSKQIFATNYQPQSITGPEDVAAFLSTQKFGISDKTEALILNNSNEIVGKFILPQHKQLEKLIELMTIYAGANSILYGNNVTQALFNNYNNKLALIGFKILDGIRLQSNNYHSIAENEIISVTQKIELNKNNINENAEFNFKVSEENSSLKYSNYNNQNIKNMNTSSLNWVEKLLLHNTKAYKDFVKNISNHKEIKANSEQDKKFLEVYYNRELKKDNPNNFLFSARTLNEKKQTTQINNFLNGSETEMFLKNIDFNNKAYLFKDIKYQNEIIINNPVLVNGILKELDDYKKEHAINHTESAKNMIFTVTTQKKQTYNLESHPYSIAEGNWIKNQEKYSNLTPKYAVSILSQNNGEKKLSFVDNRNQSIIVIDNSAITQKVISDLYAKELENRTDLSKGLTNTQIDEKQALHYRNYETEARKLGITIAPHTRLEFIPIQVKAIEFAEDYINSRRSGMNGNKEIQDYYQQLDNAGKDIFLDSFKNHISANHKENGVISKALLESKLQSLEKFISGTLEVPSETLNVQNHKKLEKIYSKISDLYLDQIQNSNSDFILKDPDISNEQAKNWRENKQNTLTKEQLGQIPDAILNFELNSNQKIKLALGEKIAFADNYDDWDYIFQKTEDNKISATYRGTGEEFLVSNSAIKLINQKIETAQSNDFGIEGIKPSEKQLDKAPEIVDGFEHIPQELEKVIEKWQEKIENGLDYNDCANILEECEDLGYTFDYGLDAEPFNLRPIDLDNQNSKVMENEINLLAVRLQKHYEVEQEASWNFNHPRGIEVLKAAIEVSHMHDDKKDLIFDYLQTTPPYIPVRTDFRDDSFDQGESNYEIALDLYKAKETDFYKKLSSLEKGLSENNISKDKLPKLEELEVAEFKYLVKNLEKYFPKEIQQISINNKIQNIMTTQNKDFDQVQYLKDQLKYLQFGEGQKLLKDLEAGINSSEKEFQIKTSSDKTLPGNTVDFTLNYNKSEKGGIFLNSYQAELKNKKGEELSHVFYISKENSFDAKEAINLLEGRSVKIEFINPKIDEKQTAFVKFDFNEPKTQYGTYKFQSFHENYGVNTAEIVDKSGLIFDKPEWRDNTIKSLERGNIVNVKFKHEDKEIEGKAFLNPQYKTLNLYDNSMNRINTNKPLEGLGNDNSHEKSNVREQSRSRGI
jgi:DNA repair protein RadC